MSFEPDSQSHELTVADYLKDISEQLRYLNEQIKEAYQTDIELSEVRKLEDCDDGT